jgi:hypothetical protein
MKRSAGVTASAVLTFIGSAFTLLMAAFAVLGALVSSRLPMTRPAPVNLGAIVAVEALFIFGFGAWGVASGVGLLKLKQWARISVIVFAAILVFCCVPAGLLMALIPLPNTSAANLPADFITVMRVGMVAFYSAFALLGGFWLYFFNRKSVREQFQTQRSVVNTSAQHFSWEAPITVPDMPTTVPGGPVRRERPLSITIIAWFLLVSSAFAAIWLPLTPQFFPRAQFPLYFLGHFFFGRATYGILIVWSAAQFVAAIGLLKLKRAGLFATIAFQCLAIVNFALLAVIPGARAKYQQALDTMMATMNANMPQLTVGNGSTHTAVNLSPFPAWAAPLFSIPLVLVILWFLITRRHAFTHAEDELSSGRP